MGVGCRLCSGSLALFGGGGGGGGILGSILGPESGEGGCVPLISPPTHAHTPSPQRVKEARI